VGEKAVGVAVASGHHTLNDSIAQSCEWTHNTGPASCAALLRLSSTRLLRLW
jgi:hypothetical protein